MKIQDNMIHNSVFSLRNIIKKIKKVSITSNRDSSKISLVIVSKNIPLDKIIPLIDSGHKVFGENKLQEAKKKWPNIKKDFPEIKLHFIGPLQSNKLREILQLFDVIETLDREKIAFSIAKEIRNQKLHKKFFVQVNTGMEIQKSGVHPRDTIEFVQKCKNYYKLNIEGLMCIPPINEDPKPHFCLLEELRKKLKLHTTSMGMSHDFEKAIKCGSNNLRIGSLIFGNQS